MSSSTLRSIKWSGPWMKL